MCRITGFISPTHNQSDLLRMRDSMHRGGPDDSGIYHDPAQHVFLGHRRLALIDLSPAGHQPMSEATGRLQIVYNGEIYNFKEIKSELISLSIQKIKSTCIRDQSIQSAEARLERKIRLESVFFLPGICPDRSLLWKVWSHYPKEHFSNTTWRIKNTLLKGITITHILLILSINPKKSFDELRTVLKAAVQRHLISDAPIGLFLSGGIDSSLLTLLAQPVLGDHLKTLSIYFSEEKYSEKKYQDIIIKKTGAHHQSFLVTAQVFNHSLPDALSAMDQPTTDGINSYFISKYAHEYGLTAVLSGIGADELFGGYPSIKMSAWKTAFSKTTQQYSFLIIPCPSRSF
ncbi:MAG: hypothetical protein IPF93_16725 [Saprospiraceae bacterium]|nr:hypothetical protein [Saprospiraceae bacterium]